MSERSTKRHPLTGLFLDPGNPAPGWRRRRDILLLCILPLMLLGWLRHVPFSWDDYTLLLTNPTIRDPAGWRELLGWGRPVRMISLWIDFQLWGENFFGFHITDLIAFLLTTVVLYRLVADLFGDADLALLTGALFLAHPIHVEVLAVVSHRKETLMTLFMLLSWMCWLRRHRWRGYYALMALTFLLAMLSKQVAIMLPVWIVVAERLGLRLPDAPPPGPSRRWLAALAWIAVPLLVGMLFSIGDFNLFGYFKLDDIGSEMHLNFVRTAPVIMVEYLRKLVFPINLQMDYMFRPVQSLADWRFWGALALLGGIAWAIWYAGRRDRIIATAGLWLLLMIFPLLNWVPQNYQMADRYAFLPSIGFALLVARILKRIGLFYRHRGSPVSEEEPVRLPWWFSFTVAALASMLVFALNFKLMLILLHPISRDLPKLAIIAQQWHHFPLILIGLWGYWAFYRMIRQHPRLTRSMVRGIWLAIVFLHIWVELFGIRARYWMNPADLYTQELRINPNSLMAHHNLAWWYEREGNYQQALKHYKASLKIDPEVNPKAYYTIGNIHALAYGQYDEAQKWYEKAIELDRKTRRPGVSSQVPDAYINLGNIYHSRGDRQRAEKLYREILERIPGFAKAYLNLGTLRHEQGDLRGAIENYSRAIESQPDAAAAWFNRGMTRLQLGQREKGIEDIRRAAQIHPDQYTEPLQRILNESGDAPPVHTGD